MTMHRVASASRGTKEGGAEAAGWRQRILARGSEDHDSGLSEVAAAARSCIGNTRPHATIMASKTMSGWWEIFSH